MADTDARTRSIEERIARLRSRIEKLGYQEPDKREVLGILKGLLDLLGDEL